MSDVDRDRQRLEGSALTQGERSDSKESRDAVPLFRQIIKAYFGAEALASLMSSEVRRCSA